jgi:hypothetical protein
MSFTRALCWGAVKGGKRGIRALFANRPENLSEWRAKGGRVAHEHHPSMWHKKVILPVLNDKLSEFIGIHPGDGTLTEHFVKITQDSRYDMPYVFYIEALTRELFGASQTIRREREIIWSMLNFSPRKYVNTCITNGPYPTETR